MCEELSACAVMTDGARSPLQREVIKKSNYECWGGTRECRGAKTGKGELDQIQQMIRAISQSGNGLDGGKCYFLPARFGVEGQ